ncbi:peptidase C13 family-domain-containing protein [Jimgerdemannia flammicorona]|uniref:Peptidase C13 family-domain-containing protein n=1 Tax=Jimgerdemannia flammicorona TaxID=994334 RepID=A0A433AZU3_9FUNG|nr:peptidase C13 family-domain-containing protein [Jimgerdemannia flammicorona]
MPSTRPTPPCLLLLLFVACALTFLCLPSFATPSTPTADVVDGFFSRGGHTNNWAVLVCTSRFWFNYRHIANTLSMYRTVKRLGIPDSNIILMLADDVACNPRNKFPATVFNNAARLLDLYGENVEVDYRGYEVTVENFIRMLTGELRRWVSYLVGCVKVQRLGTPAKLSSIMKLHPQTPSQPPLGRVSPDTPRSKRLLTDDRSNIFIYMTGHGGNEFLKFQDAEEISAYDLADAFEQMWEKRSQHYVQPDILAQYPFHGEQSAGGEFLFEVVLSRLLSLSITFAPQHHTDFDIGVAVIDSYTYYNLEFLENIDMSSNATLKQLVCIRFMRSHELSLPMKPPALTNSPFRSRSLIPMTPSRSAVSPESATTSLSGHWIRWVGWESGPGHKLTLRT